MADRTLTVYTARRIHTMEPGWPTGTAVAVDDRGRVVSVGRDLDDLRPWTDAFPTTIDGTFEDKVLLPGFVEPHLHPLLAATYFPSTFVTPDPWKFPSGVVGGIPDGPALLDVVARRHEEMGPGNDWLFLFGYTKAAHGTVGRPDLDAVCDTRPVAIGSRSSHVMIVNSAALEALDLTEGHVADSGFGHFVDWEQGYFSEDGQFSLLMPRIRPIMQAPDRLRGGLELLRGMLNANGVTTMHEPGSGMYSGGRPQHEVAALAPILEGPDVPLRTLLTPGGMPFIRRLGLDDAIDAIGDVSTHDGDRITFTRKKVKFFADGSYVDQIGQWDEPGYIDGHRGQWMTPPDTLREWCRAFWMEGYDVHVHVQGDLGARLAVDILEDLQAEKPRFHHGFTLEHLSGATPATLHRAAALGASVSTLVWPLHSVGEQFRERVLGIDRLHQVFPLQSVVRNGMTLGIHADTIVSPPEPMRLAWMAANRLSPNGHVLGEHERLTVEQALHAITLGPARILRREDDLGSIRAGKWADFAVLDEDPFDVAPADLCDVPIWGTVFQGAPHPVGG